MDIKDKFENEKKLEEVLIDMKFNERRAAVFMATRCHRSLQQKFFCIAYNFIKLCADNYDAGMFDDRNKWTCETSKAIIESLKTKGLYHESDFNDLMPAKTAFETIRELERNVLYKNGKIDLESYEECLRKSVEPKMYTRYLLLKCDVFVDVLAIAVSVERVYEDRVKREEVIEWLKEFKENHHQLI